MSAAVDTALSDYPDADTGFTSALKHSADVFAAFKVHSAQRSMAAQLLTPDGSLKPFEQWANDVLPIASHQFGPWLRTEYDTAILRARQAADWQRFERNKDIMPNLRWVPSTSAKPGADHRIFWGTVLPIDHQFWSSHRPGDRWNCKCSLEATDEPAKGVPQDSESGHTALLLDESKKHNGKQLPALDLELDGVKIDIRSVTGRGWYSNIFVAKNKQLHRYISREDVTASK